MKVRRLLLVRVVCGLFVWLLTLGQPLWAAPQPIAWWKFDEGAGASVADASGNGHIGTVVGPAVWTNGIIGKALHFGGASRITIPIDPSLLLGPQLTVQAFIRPTDYKPATFKYLVELWDNYLLRFDTPAEGGQLSFFTSLDGNWEPRLSSGIPDLGEWHQVFAVWTGANLQLWVDGVVRARARMGTPTAKTNQLVLGRGFIGAMDELKIYNRALSESEILAEMLPVAKAAVRVPRPVLEVGEVFTISCLVSNVGGQALTGGAARLVLPPELTLVEGITPTNIPSVTRTAPALLQWRAMAATALSTNLSVQLRFSGLADIEPTAPVVAGRLPPSPAALYTGPSLTAVSNDIILANAAVRLVFPSNTFGYGVWAIDARKSDAWTRMAVANSFSRLAVKSGAQVLRRIVQARNYRPLSPGPGQMGVEFSETVNDGADATWTCRFSFILSNDDRVSIHYEATPDQDGLLAAFAGPTLYVGERSFGAAKDDALFCGLEWLVAGESSSSNLDMHDPAHYIRFVPHPNKITIPLMALANDSTALALFWDAQQAWDGTNTQPAAIFASPNFLDGQDNHLLGLFIPSVPRWTRQNQLEALRNPYSFKAQAPLRLDARLACVTPAPQSVACLPRWFDTFGVPEPAPLPRGAYTNELDFSMRAFMESLWDAPAQKWWTSKDGPALMSYLALPASYTFQLRMGALLTTNAHYRTQYLDRAAFAEQLGGFRPSWDDLGFTWASPIAALNGWRSTAASRLDSMGSDGSWRFHARLETNGIFAGYDYGLLGPDNAAEIGTCARNAYEILRYARVTGDSEAFRGAEKALRFMDQFTVPRAAQVWECPVHSPDVLAAADAVDAYLEAFRYSGDPHYREQAVAWAWRGLPFIYVWNPPDHPELRHASIAIYGGSWFEGSWIGQPVQWNGLRYAYALLKLADHDQSFPWRKFAEGITRSALYQQDQTGANVALWPDNFSAINWTKCPWVFQPGDILKNVFNMLGHDIEPRTTIVAAGTNRLFITSRATISGGSWTADRLTFGAKFPDGESGHIVIASIWKPSAVLENGAALTETQGDLWALTADAWKYDTTSGFLVIKLLETGPHSLEIVDAEFRPGSQMPAVATTIEFNFTADLGGWMPANQIPNWSLENGMLKGTASGGDPYMRRGRLRLDASQCSRIAVRARASAGSHIALYWITEDSPSWDEAKSIHRPLQPGTNFSQYLFEVGKHPLWAGKTVTGIRLDPLEAHFLSRFVRKPFALSAFSRFSISSKWLQGSELHSQ